MRNRIVHIDYDEKLGTCFELSFSTYALLLYYAEQVNHQKALVLYSTLRSHYWYNSNFDLSTENMDKEDDTVWFNLDNFHQAIDFIDNQLIPSLEKEPEYLLNKYGGFDNFYNNLFYNSFFGQYLSIYPDENYLDNSIWLIEDLESIREIINNAIKNNTAYGVWIY